MDIFHLTAKVHYDLVSKNAYYRKAYAPNEKPWTEEQVQKFKEYLKSITPQDTNESTIAPQ